MDTRIEKDSMGEIAVPVDRLYGAQTRRAEINFPVSGRPLPWALIAALARIKGAAARVNVDLKKLTPDLGAAIARAADEILAGGEDAWRAQFPVDIFQTGSGTSSNMNVNEVLANLASRALGGAVGTKNPVHPNDHVNLGQSSNDVFPTAVHIAAGAALDGLAIALDSLAAALGEKARAWDDVVTLGRTHLQDATPIRLGQVFGGYAAQAKDAGARCRRALERNLLPVALGGTAVGTGINTHPEFAGRVLELLAAATGFAWREADNHCAAQAAADGLIAAAGAVKAVGVALVKIANDIRFLASGPRAGYGQLRLKDLQPGSSIMPGKVNPVLCETLLQAAAAAAGMEATVAFGCAILSQFELSLAWPTSATAFLDATGALARATELFTREAVIPLEADRKRCRALCDESLALCTALAPAIGYDRAAALSAEAARDGKTIREVAQGLLPDAELDRLLDPFRMTRPEPGTP